MSKPSIFGKDLHFILDVGYSSVKAALVSNKVAEVLDVAQIPPVDNEERRKYEILRAIRAFINNHKIKVNTVDLVISDPSIYTRLMVLKNPKSDLSPIVSEMMEASLPYGITHAQVNHYIIGEFDQDGDSWLQVLGVSILRNVLKSTVDTLSKLGLTVRTVQLSPLAMQSFIEHNSLHRKKKTTSVMTIDFGAKSTEACVFQGEKLMLHRCIPISGKLFTSAIAEELEGSYANSEMLKIQFGIAADNLDAISGKNDQELETQRAMIPLCQELVAEIQRIIAAYLSHSSDQEISNIIVCGGGSRLKNLPDFLQSKLNIPTSKLKLSAQSPCKHLVEDIVNNKRISDNIHFYNLVLGAYFQVNNDKQNFNKHIKQMKIKQPAALSTTSPAKFATIWKKWMRELKRVKLPTYNVRMPLGYQGINLNFNWGLDLKNIAIFGIIIIAIVLLGYIGFLNNGAKRYSKKVSTLQSQYNEIQAKAGKTRKLSSKIKQIKKQDGNSQSPAEHLVIYTLLQKINNLILSPLQVTNIKYQLEQNSFLIEGIDSVKDSKVGDFLQQLQQLKEFNRVNLEFIKLKNTSTKEFKIIGEL